MPKFPTASIITECNWWLRIHDMYRVIIFSNCVYHCSIITIGKVSVTNSLRQSFKFFPVELSATFEAHCCKQMSRFDNVVVKLFQGFHLFGLFVQFISFIDRLGNFGPIYVGNENYCV